MVRPPGGARGGQRGLRGGGGARGRGDVHGEQEEERESHTRRDQGDERQKEVTDRCYQHGSHLSLACNLG